MLKPKKISDVQLAFPTTIEGFLPKYQTLPEEFREEESPFSERISSLFYGKAKQSEFVAKDGIDATAAWRHISYCLNSWEPKHEHKMAGCAYLLSLWFDLAVSNG
jgi:hypothetical protein